MSVKAVSWVLDDLQALKPGPTLVMLALADFADERNSCFPGQARLAARARCSRRSVIRHLDELKRLGLISVETRVTHDAHGHVRRTSNRYVLHVGLIANTESDILALSCKSAAQSECDILASSVTESDKTVTESDTSVTLTPSPRTTSTLPSLHPSQIAFSQTPSSWDEPDGSLGKGGEVFPEDLPPATSLPESTPNRCETFLNSAKGTDAQLDRVEAFRGSCSEEKSDSELVAEILPGRMHMIPSRDHAKVARAIRQRLQAGWSEDQLRIVLESRALPETVRHMTALVLARFRDDLPPNSPPSWSATHGEASSKVRRHSPVSRVEQELARAKHEFVCDRKAGDALARSGFNAWLAHKYPELVDAT